MAIAIDPSISVPCVIVADRELPEDQRTIFYLKPMTRRSSIKYADRLKTSTTTLDEELELLSDHLTGWSNFRDSNGADIAFEKNMASNIDKMNLGTFVGILSCLLEISSMKPTDLKN